MMRRLLTVEASSVHLGTPAFQTCSEMLLHALGPCLFSDTLLPVWPLVTFCMLLDIKFCHIPLLNASLLGQIFIPRLKEHHIIMQTRSDLGHPSKVQINVCQRNQSWTFDSGFRDRNILVAVLCSSSSAMAESMARIVSLFSSKNIDNAVTAGFLSRKNKENKRRYKMVLCKLQSLYNLQHNSLVSTFFSLLFSFSTTARLSAVNPSKYFFHATL